MSRMWMNKHINCISKLKWLLIIGLVPYVTMFYLGKELNQNSNNKKSGLGRKTHFQGLLVYCVNECELKGKGAPAEMAGGSQAKPCSVLAVGAQCCSFQGDHHRAPLSGAQGSWLEK